MKRLAVLTIVALASCGRTQLPAATIAASVPASYTHHRTFLYLGKKQFFKVPANVTSISVVAIGGEGGGGTVSHGGRVSAVLPVTSGEVLYVRVGGNGTSKASGYNGGGDTGPGFSGSYYFNGYGGGGASDIRQNGDTLKDRILVSGGGGGQGGYDQAQYGFGGKGGAKIGGEGAPGYGYRNACSFYRNYGGCGGGGGTQKAGGAGGIGVGNFATCGGSYAGAQGSPGTLGVGGEGGGGAQTSRGGGACAGVGGGGGGGYYGGGGGGEGGGYSGRGGGGGGGGGSSYAERSALNVQMWQGWNKNEYGLIVLSW